MLTTARPVASYRSVASAVRTRLLDARVNDEPQRPVSPMLNERIDTLRDLLQLGYQYGPRPDHRLDTTAGSAPAKFDLALELYELVPKRLDRYQKDDFDLRDWVLEAVDLLSHIRGGMTWSELTDDEREFTELEFLPFLQQLVSKSPQAPDW